MNFDVGACDFCNKPLGPHEFIIGSGANYVRSTRQIGHSEFGWICCNSCCRIEFSRYETFAAIHRRAKRTSREWGRAVKVYIKKWTGIDASNEHHRIHAKIKKHLAAVASDRASCNHELDKENGTTFASPSE